MGTVLRLRMPVCCAERIAPDHKVSDHGPKVRLVQKSPAAEGAWAVEDDQCAGKYPGDSPGVVSVLARLVGSAVALLCVVGLCRNHRAEHSDAKI